MLLLNDAFNRVTFPGQETHLPAEPGMVRRGFSSLIRLSEWKKNKPNNNPTHGADCVVLRPGSGNDQRVAGAVAGLFLHLLPPGFAQI